MSNSIYLNCIIGMRKYILRIDRYRLFYFCMTSSPKLDGKKSIYTYQHAVISCWYVMLKINVPVAPSLFSHCFSFLHRNQYYLFMLFLFSFRTYFLHLTTYAFYEYIHRQHLIIKHIIVFNYFRLIKYLFVHRSLYKIPSIITEKKNSSIQENDSGLCWWLPVVSHRK